MAFAVLHHKAGTDPVEQVENAGGVAVDEGGGHADDPVRHGEDLRHSVALAAVVVVLVELVHNAAVQPALVPALEIGAHGVAPAGPGGWVVPVRVFRDHPDLLQRRLMLCFPQVLRSAAAVNPAVGADLDPFTRSGRVDRRPERASAAAALVVSAALRAEEKLVDLACVPDPVLRKGRLNGAHAVRTEVRPLAPVPNHGGLLHKAVPGLLLGDDGIDALIALFV